MRVPTDAGEIRTHVSNVKRISALFLLTIMCEMHRKAELPGRESLMPRRRYQGETVHEAPSAGISTARAQFMVNKRFMVNELSIPSVDFDQMS